MKNFFSSFLLTAMLCIFFLLYGLIIGASSQDNSVLIEKCNETNGKYDFCEKKEFWSVK